MMTAAFDDAITSFPRHFQLISHHRSAALGRDFLRRGRIFTFAPERYAAAAGFGL